MFPLTKLKNKCLPLFTVLISSTTFISATTVINTLQTDSVQAQTIPVKSSSPWQQASFPVENFQAYTSGFGYRTHPVTGKTSFHQGLDIAAPLGSYVRSWWGGKIVGLSDHTACGTMIKIKSGNWTHTYCHLMGTVENNGNGSFLIDRNGGILLQHGQTVPSGVRIGRIGMTGRTTGPH